MIARLIAAALVALAAAAIPAHAQDEVKPSVADPRVRNYDSPDLVFAEAPATAPLVVYMSGTGGDSSKPPRALLRTIAQQGYRVIFLTYDDDPAVSQVCPRRPPECSERFRATRVFGDANGGPVQNPPEEAIVPRLTMLLRYLAKTKPDQAGPAISAATGNRYGTGLCCRVSRKAREWPPSWQRSSQSSASCCSQAPGT